MINGIRHILRLSFSDKWLLIKMICLSVFLRGWIKFINYKSAQQFLSRFTPNKVDTRSKNVDIRRFERLIMLCRRITGIFANCLSISLAFHTAMLRRDIHTDMRFGMKKEENKLIAHAWLEYNGRPLADNNVNITYKSFNETIL